MSSALKKPLEDLVKKIFEDASKTGIITKEQLAVILIYEQECKNEINPIKDLLGSGELIAQFIEKILG